MAFDRGDRTYHVSDERLKAFKTLSTLEKLHWQEEVATFIRLTQLSRQNPASKNGEPAPEKSTR
ncbi:MAG: hypothetical protein ACOY5S_02410 [Pseudomonadota bacterium]